MFSRILKVLKESISSVTNVNQWEMITKDLLKQEITGYGPVGREKLVESCPKYSENQLVTIKYHRQYAHLHKEVGIILAVNDHRDPLSRGSIHIYEILVGDEKITLVERYLVAFEE